MPRIGRVGTPARRTRPGEDEIAVVAATVDVASVSRETGLGTPRVAGPSSAARRPTRLTPHRDRLIERPPTTSRWHTKIGHLGIPRFRGGIVYEETRCQSGGSTTPSSVR